MGQKSKTPKGEISLTNCQGRIRLRWRYAGQRYSLNIPYAYGPENLHYATVRVTEIKLDMLRGCFDTSLKKYGYLPTAKPIKAKTALLEAKGERILFLHELPPKFNEWARHFRNVDIDGSFDYLYIRKWLEKGIQVPINSIAEKLNSAKWAVSTYNRRLSYLTSFLTWLVDSGKMERNPLKFVNKKREKRKIKCSRRNPLEEHEIVSFLDAIKNDRYCPTSSRFKHSHYYPFLAFIFLTGVRNAEAIGLKVRHLDFQSNQIEISQTLARTTQGSNHASRIEKGTKTQNIRLLPLTSELRALLEPQVANKGIEEYVFVSPKGLTIDDRMLKRRVIKLVMQKIGLGDRDLYCARHSFGTRAIQQGMSLTDVGYLLGHNTVETAMRNYVSVARKATTLPTINKLA